MSARHIFLAAAVVSLTGSGCGRSSSAPEQKQGKTASETREPVKQPDNVVVVSDEMLRDLRITTSIVEKRRGGEAANLLGELGVNQNAYAEVGSSLQGRVVSLRVAEGQQVNQGQPLAVIESGELARARGDLTTAEARLLLARQTLERKRGLVAERIAPARELQEADNEAAAAEAQLRAARATLDALGAPERQPDDARASSLVLTSPMSGTVLERSAVVGQIVDPSKPLFRIANLSTLWLTVQAFERDAVRLQVGASAGITFAAIPGRVFDGAIAFIGRTVNVESRTVSVRIDLRNENGLLRPGMSANALLPVGDQSTDLLTVPSAALQRVRDRWCVFIPKTESSFEIRPVGRGRDLAGEVEIVYGVKAGEPIVVDGAFLLKAETERASSEGEHEEHR